MRQSRKQTNSHRHNNLQNHLPTVQRKQQTPPPNRHSLSRHSLSRICVTGAVNCRLAILRPTVSTAGVLSATNCARMAVVSMCTVGITTVMRVCVNIQPLRTVSTAPNINAVSPTAIIADGPDLNTVHITNETRPPVRHRRSCLCLKSFLKEILAATIKYMLKEFFCIYKNIILQIGESS